MLTILSFLMFTCEVRDLHQLFCAILCEKFITKPRSSEMVSFYFRQAFRLDRYRLKIAYSLYKLFTASPELQIRIKFINSFETLIGKILIHEPNV